MINIYTEINIMRGKEVRTTLVLNITAALYCVERLYQKGCLRQIGSVMRQAVKTLVNVYL